MKRQLSVLVREHRLIAIMLVASALMFSSCGTPIQPEPTPLQVGGMEVEFSEVSSFAASDAIATEEDTVIHIRAHMAVAGSVNDDTFDIIFPKGIPVPFSVHAPNDPDVTVVYCEGGQSLCRNFFADPSTGNMTITITQLSPTVKGTFHGVLDLVPAGSSDNVRTITSGQFNAGY